MPKIDETLADRGGRYGDFRDNAVVAQAIKDAMRAAPGWEGSPAYVRDGADLIAGKLGRMFTGDVLYDDNFHDIIGYAKLMQDRAAQDRAAQDRAAQDRDSPPAEEPIPTNLEPRWRRQLFGTWQPRHAFDGRWVVVMERMAQPVLYFVDEMDRDAGHHMDEDEALDRARSLNAVGYTGEYDPAREHWHAVPQDHVPDPIFIKDPLRAAMIAANQKDKP